MKTKFLVLIALISLQSAAQAPAIAWQKSLGGTGIDQAKSIKQTADGGYIVAGSSKSTNGDVTGNHGMADYWIVKLDALGNIVWQKSLGGSQDDYAESMVLTSDGGCIVAGYSKSNDGDVTGNHGDNDYWIVKLDDLGTIMWQKTFGGTSSDGATCIQQNSDGGYIVGGNAASNNGDVITPGGWLIKLNASGNIIWQKSYTNSIKCVNVNSDGGFIIGGQVVSYVGWYNYYSGIAKRLDADGNEMWHYGTGNDTLSAIQAIDGNFLLTGQSNLDYSLPPINTYNGSTAYVSKRNSSGGIIWGKSMGAQLSTSSNHSINQTSDGGFIVSGARRAGDSWYRVFRLDAAGNILWQKADSDSASAGVGTEIQQTTDGGYIMCGYNAQSVGSNYIIVKFGSDAALAMSEFEKQKQTKIYPNPTQDNITISANEDYKSISIHDISGKVLFQTEEQLENLSLSGYDYGIYFLLIQFENGKTEIHKIIKQ